MTDVFSRSQRSAIMARVRSSGNRSTELRLIALFRKHRVTGWRRHQSLPGRPDFVFPRSRLAVFVDGCFWHGCPQHFTSPQVRRGYWEAKIGRNRKRDCEVNRTLRAAGWRVLRLWEHSLSGRKGDRSAEKVRNAAVAAE